LLNRQFLLRITILEALVHCGVASFAKDFVFLDGVVVDLELIGGLFLE